MQRYALLNLRVTSLLNLNKQQHWHQLISKRYNIKGETYFIVFLFLHIWHFVHEEPDPQSNGRATSSTYMPLANSDRPRESLHSVRQTLTRPAKTKSVLHTPVSCSQGIKWDSASPLIMEKKKLYLASDLYYTFIFNSTSPILDSFYSKYLNFRISGLKRAKRRVVGQQLAVSHQGLPNDVADRAVP